MRKRVKILRGKLSPVLEYIETYLKEGYRIEQTLLEIDTTGIESSESIVPYKEYLCILTKDTL